MVTGKVEGNDGRHPTPGATVAGVSGVDYDERQFHVYARGRAIDADRMAGIVAEFSLHLPERRPLTIVDVGAGVGRFSPALAEAFGGPVLGVEPAARMREQAEVLAAHPRVRYLDGRAESLPLENASCDAAFMWFVWHHVVDKEGAAREVARVVRPGGTLLLRTNTADRMPAQWWFEQFPRAREIEQAVSPTLGALVAGFALAGWSLRRVATVVTRSTFGRDLEMLRLRSISTLEHLSDDEFHAGLAAAELAAAGREREPVATPGDLFVFDRRA